MNDRSKLVVGTMVLVLAVLSGLAIAAQDKYTLKLPSGLAFSDWQ